MFDKEFEKKVRKFFGKNGWTIQRTSLADFVIERDFFRIQILLGPNFFDLRFPVVEAGYTKRLIALKGALKEPVVLVVIRDQNTIPLYRPMQSIPVSLVKHENIEKTNLLTADFLDVAPLDDEWPIRLVRSNTRLCRLMIRRSMTNKAPDRALYWAESAVILDDHDPFNHFELAGVQLFVDRINEASISIQSAIKLLPDDASLFNRASAIALKQKDTAQALSFAKKAVEANNRRPSDYNFLARLYLLVSDFNAAEVNVCKAIDLEPDNDQFRLTLATLDSRKSNPLISTFE